MPTLKQTFQLVSNMGLRYTSYRIGLEVQKRLGTYEKKFPIDPTPTSFITLSQWKDLDIFWGVQQGEKNPGFLPGEIPDFSSYHEGRIPFFSFEEINLGKDYDWLTNPDTGHKYPGDVHWSRIQDYDAEAGDIKFVWEKSRFAYLHDIIRHDFHTGEDHSKWVFDEIKSWLDANPINCGPNYKCSQEISLRVLNWTYALNYYKHSKHLKKELFERIIHTIYWQTKHVYSNINFSRIAVRNNHAITETLTLYLVGLFYPFFPEATKWKVKGKKWFEQEVEYQIYPDGTFLQFSMNYHRVVVQLFTWAIKSAEFADEKFNEVVYDRAYKSLQFLSACQDTSTGWLPNYGSNDGALFFKFNSCNYRDYRPQLNALHILLTGRRLYTSGDWDEDVYWFGLKDFPGLQFNKIDLTTGWSNFPNGGYYVLRESDTLTFIRCGNHKDRPAQADNLHLDIWYKGENVLFDGGSYKYNTDKHLLKYFMGTESHNTVMLDYHDQMLKGSRFIWYNWSQALLASTLDNDSEFTFTGEISAFTFLNSDTSHRRFIRKEKGKPVWIIEDTVIKKPQGVTMKQRWHPLPNLAINSVDQNNEHISPIVEEGLRSDYYGKKEVSSQISFETFGNFIKTTIQIK